MMIHRTVIGLLVLVCGVGGVACGGDDDDSATVPAGVSAAIDGFDEAVNAYDSEALTAHTTEDFTWQSTGEVQDRPEFVAYFERYYESNNFHREATGERVIEPEGDAYVATEPDHVTATGFDAQGVSVFRVVQIDGDWLVQEMRWQETSPDTDS